jgi:hypothetical protein
MDSQSSQQIECSQDKASRSVCLPDKQHFYAAAGWGNARIQRTASQKTASYFENQQLT